NSSQNSCSSGFSSRITTIVLDRRMKGGDFGSAVSHKGVLSSHSLFSLLTLPGDTSCNLSSNSCGTPSHS
ncbi:hypothetical protein A2U01_0048287, partial [Trifolium medium]|nr:hypothetical protein [Trifolium medium]